MGIAYNGVYLTWFEIGRTELLRDTGLTYDDVEKSGYHLPLSETGIKYLKPALYDDVLTIVACVSMQKGARLRFKYEIQRNGELLAEGFTEHVFTNSNLRPVKPPNHLINLDSRFAECND